MGLAFAGGLSHHALDLLRRGFDHRDPEAFKENAFGSLLAFDTESREHLGGAG